MGWWFVVKGPTKKYLVSAQTYFRDMKFLHALDLKMTRKRYKSGGIKAKILQLNVSLLIEIKGSAVFEPRTSKLHVVDQCFSVR